MNPARDRGIRTELEACVLLSDAFKVSVRRKASEGIREDHGDVIGVPDCTVQVSRTKDEIRSIADRARTKLAAVELQQQRAGTRHGVVLLRIDGAGRRPGVWRAIVNSAELELLGGKVLDLRIDAPQGWTIRHAPDKVTGGWHLVATNRYVATLETWATDLRARLSQPAPI